MSEPLRVDVLTRILSELDFLLACRDWDAADRVLSFWHVAEFRLGPISEVVLAPSLTADAQPGDAELVARQLTQLRDDLVSLRQSKSAIAQWDIPRLHTLYNLAFKQDGLARKSLTILGETIELTPDVAEHISQFLEAEFHEESEVTGKVTSLWISEKGNRARLRPDFGEGELNCRFPKSLISTALAAYGKRVTVRGTFHGWKRDMTFFMVDPAREILILD